MLTSKFATFCNMPNNTHNVTIMHPLKNDFIITNTYLFYSECIILMNGNSCTRRFTNHGGLTDQQKCPNL